MRPTDPSNVIHETDDGTPCTHSLNGLGEEQVAIAGPDLKDVDGTVQVRGEAFYFSHRNEINRTCVFVKPNLTPDHPGIPDRFLGGGPNRNGVFTA